MSRKTEAAGRLLEVMARLRRECPWDRKQTLESLRHNTIEEVYELSEAILGGDMEGIKEEAGDLLLHVVFYAQIAEETGAFDFADIANSLCDKLIYRHPHIYGDVVAETSEEVKANWEALKVKKKSHPGGVLSGLPASMPALVKAHRLGEKAAAAGFDWERPEDVWEKVREEIREVEAEMTGGTGAAASGGGDPAGTNAGGFDAGADSRDAADAAASSAELEGEFGDLLFALAQAARLYGVDPDAALERTNRKFIRRFEAMERASGKPLRERTADELEALWQEAKKKTGGARSTPENTPKIP